ncbi:MAG: DUF3147 family protein [Candidatus Falkowbacteria bacterium]
MTFQIIKIIISALLIWIISEISKRFTFWGAVLASVPLVSVLSFVWIYAETKDIMKISRLSYSIFWLVIPSLVLFAIFPILLKLKINFFLSLILSIGATSLSYWLMICALGWCNIRL